jgi:hypothetical protein
MRNTVDPASGLQPPSLAAATCPRGARRCSVHRSGHHHFGQFRLRDRLKNGVILRFAQMTSGAATMAPAFGCTPACCPTSTVPECLRTAEHRRPARRRRTTASSPGRCDRQPGPGRGRAIDALRAYSPTRCQHRPDVALAGFAEIQIGETYYCAVFASSERGVATFGDATLPSAGGEQRRLGPQVRGRGGLNKVKNPPG